MLAVRWHFYCQCVFSISLWRKTNTWQEREDHTCFLLWANLASLFLLAGLICRSQTTVIKEHLCQVRCFFCSWHNRAVLSFFSHSYWLLFVCKLVSPQEVEKLWLLSHFVFLFVMYNFVCENLSSRPKSQHCNNKERLTATNGVFLPFALFQFHYWIWPQAENPPWKWIKLGVKCKSSTKQITSL